MFHEFDLVSTSTVETAPLPRPEGYPQRAEQRRVITMQLTHRPTGESASGRFFRNLTPGELKNWLENMALKKFPASQAAEMLRSRLNLVPVVLVPGWEDSIGEAIHTALRKVCDSPATSYWWNLLHALPAELPDLLYRDSVAALRRTGAGENPVFLRALAKALAKSWATTLEAARDYFSPRPLWGRAEPAPALAGWPDRAQLTLARMEDLHTQSHMAGMAVKWLDQDDWAGMLGYLTKAAKEPDVNAADVA